MNKCPYCGAPLKSDVCEYCDSTIVEENNNKNNSNNSNTKDLNIITNKVQIDEKISEKNNLTALLLCIFFGWLGFHRFYTGKIVSGIVYFLTVGLFGLGIIYDLILIACHSFKDNKGNTLVWKKNE